MFTRAVLRLLAAAALWLPSQPLPAAAEVLRIGVTQFPSSFHPATELMLVKGFVLGMTRRPLTAYDAEWRLVCMLCVTLPTLENGLAKIEPSADGRQGVALTFQLQPGATWGDGVPVTSADVAFTVELGKHPESGFGNADLYRRIDKIEIKDDKTFVLHLAALTFDYNALPLEILPAHVERPRFGEPAEYKRRTAYDSDTTNPALYFGPYRIAAVERGGHVVLERNPTWYGPPPAFERVVVKTVENSQALQANLLAGDIDMIAGEAGLAVEEAAALERRLTARHRVLYTQSLLFEHIDANLGNPLLADRRVRQALLYGLDREAINRELFGGRQPPAQSLISPAAPYHAPDAKSYPYDPATAAALLDAAGWRLGEGGLRRNAAGAPLEIELVTTAGNRSRELMQQVIQAQWRKLGVTVRLRAEPPRAFFGHSLARRQFRDLAMFAWATAPEAVPRNLLHSAEVPGPENNWGGQNVSGYRSPEMDALLEAIPAELDPARRTALWRRLQALYAEDLPALPLFFRILPTVVPRWLDGFVPTSHQFPSSLWIENWRRSGA